MKNVTGTTGGIYENEPSNESQYSDEEKQALLNALQDIEAKRQATKMQPLIEQYKREIYAIRGERHKADEVRAKYAALGVDVNNINFKV